MGEVLDLVEIRPRHFARLKQHRAARLIFACVLLLQVLVGYATGLFDWFAHAQGTALLGWTIAVICFCAAFSVLRRYLLKRFAPETM